MINPFTYDSSWNRGGLSWHVIGLPVFYYFSMSMYSLNCFSTKLQTDFFHSSSSFQVAQLETEKATAEAELEDALHKIALLEEKNNAGGGVGDDTSGSVSATLQVHHLQNKLRTVQEELFTSEAG